ncbi:MAG TPA: hypothetical protein VH835_00180 [Dongiaceae bacterium]|jgi:hypothetical protein
MRTGLLLVPLLALSGCAAELVASEYDFRPQGAGFSQFISDLNSGARQLNDFAAVDCRFQTNLTVPPPMSQHIDLDINGAVGSPGSSAHLLAFNGEGITCVPALPNVQGNLIITLDMSSEQPLAVGQAVPILTSTIVMDDNSEWQSDGLYGSFTITALNQAEGTATGIFELVATNRTDTNDTRFLILRGGLFNADM